MPNWYKTQRLHRECTCHPSIIHLGLNTLINRDQKDGCAQSLLLSWQRITFDLQRVPLAGLVILLVSLPLS
jgi:hypothetical protein